MNSKKIELFSTIKVRTTHPECVLVFDPSRDLFYEFNSSGSELFLYIYENKTNRQIVKTLVDKYEMEKDEAKKTLEDFFNKLLELGIAFEI